MGVSKDTRLLIHCMNTSCHKWFIMIRAARESTAQLGLFTFPIHKKYLSRDDADWFHIPGQEAVYRSLKFLTCRVRSDCIAFLFPPSTDLKHTFVHVHILLLLFAIVCSV